MRSGAREPNTLLISLFRTSLCSEAKALFDGLLIRNLMPWNALLAAYARNGQIVEAEGLFKRSPMHGLVSYNTMVSAYTRVGNLHQAREMFDRLPERDIVSCNLLIHAYAKREQVDEAQRIFELVDHPDVILCHTMLVAYGQKGLVSSAKAMFDRIPQNDELSWSALVQAYAQNGHLYEARAVLQRMPAWSAVGWTSLMTMNAKRGRVDEVLEIFDLMPHRDFVSWNALLAGFATAAEHEPVGDRAGRVFHMMPRHDIVGWTTLLTTYSASGDHQGAKQLFDSMPEWNQVSWNAMLVAYAQNGLEEEAIRLFSAMDLEGVRPDRAAYCVVLDACSRLACLPQGKLIHFEASNSGLVTDAVVGTAVINMYGKCGKAPEARSVFDGIYYKDVVSWTSMFGAYADSGQAEAVLQLFPELELAGTSSDGVALLCVLSACITTGRVSDGVGYFRSMRVDYGVEPGVDHYVCMADLLGRGGELENAEELINSMPFEPDGPSWAALLVSCSIHSDADRAERTIYKLEKARSSKSLERFNPPT